MNRTRDRGSTGRPAGGLKDMPLCEWCGRPVKVRSQDELREELLCATCAPNSRARESEENDYQRGWT
jgi:hypothetical protein